MTTTTKPKSEHYHAWSGETAGEEVTVLRKGPPTFSTRKDALVWLRDRCGGLSKVLVCRDKHCPALDLGDDVPSPEPSPPRTRRRPAPQPGGSPF